MGRRRGIERQGRGRRGRKGRRRERGRRGCDVCAGGKEKGRGVLGDEGGGDWRRCCTLCMGLAEVGALLPRCAWTREGNWRRRYGEER
ncbi:hypothetical protein MRB53_001937 [Persea americana]|uniref:Uncharacterized protein n=1 Tax=Persea americana TaxID=3435 RepID=A0ACC2MUQ8_PERAE|nr:hypothetical protein MRB53_001937 [Persea americana]